MLPLIPGRPPAGFAAITATRGVQIQSASPRFVDKLTFSLRCFTILYLMPTVPYYVVK